MKFMRLWVIISLLMPILCFANHKNGKGFSPYYRWELNPENEDFQSCGIFLNMPLWHCFFLDTRVDYTSIDITDYFSIAVGLKFKIWSPLVFSFGTHFDGGLKWLEDDQFGWTAGVDFFVNSFGATTPINIEGSIDYGSLYSSTSEPIWTISTGVFFHTDIFELWSSDQDTIPWYE